MIMKEVIIAAGAIGEHFLFIHLREVDFWGQGHNDLFLPRKGK